MITLVYLIGYQKNRVEKVHYLKLKFHTSELMSDNIIYIKAYVYTICEKLDINKLALKSFQPQGLRKCDYPYSN